MQHWIFIAINSIYCNNLYIATIYFETIVAIGFFLLKKKAIGFTATQMTLYFHNTKTTLAKAP